MGKAKYWIITGVVMAIFSYIIMKVMYVIDPVGDDTGLATTLIFIFMNVPMWTMATLMEIIGIVFLLKEKRKKKSLSE